MQTAKHLRHEATRTSESGALEALGEIACVSNKLAKLLEGTPYQCLAYDIKILALSSLVVSGVANPKGRHAGGTVGLTFFGRQLHCPPGRMSAGARALLARKCADVQTTAPVSELLRPEQREILMTFCKVAERDLSDRKGTPK
jgi:hypothetical protein